MKQNKTSQPHRFKWRDFIKYYNDLLDREIISFCTAHTQIYLGGKCRLSASVKEDEFTKETYLVAEAVLYYRNQFTGQNIQRNLTNRFHYGEFERDADTLHMLRGLLSEPLEMEIAAPKLDPKGELP